MDYGTGPPLPNGVAVAGDAALYRGWAYRLGDPDDPVAVPPAGGSLAAPMPGSVLRVAVEEGDQVEPGEVLVLLEAMKMELAVQAPAAGVVRDVLVGPGRAGVEGAGTTGGGRAVSGDRVTVVEVGPRDGLQNEERLVPSLVKVQLIEELAACGLPVVEVTSFVRPDAVPQLADAADVLAAVVRRPGVRYPVLVPNMRGMAAG